MSAQVCGECHSKQVSVTPKQKRVLCDGCYGLSKEFEHERDRFTEKINRQGLKLATL
jgi:hypothetical protein